MYVFSLTQCHRRFLLLTLNVAHLPECPSWHQDLSLLTHLLLAHGCVGDSSFCFMAAVPVDSSALFQPPEAAG